MRGPRFGQALILIPLAAVSIAFGAGGARAQDSAEEPADHEHYQLRAELGTEYDSNAHRVEQFATSQSVLVASFLQRFVVIGQLVDQIAPRQAIAVAATAAAKIFDAAAARSETVAIAQSSLMWRLALGPRTSLAPSGNYYEAFQSWGPEGDPAGERRDFRSLAPALEPAPPTTPSSSASPPVIAGCCSSPIATSTSRGRPPASICAGSSAQKAAPTGRHARAPPWNTGASAGRRTWARRTDSPTRGRTHASTIW
jgi:hypothetical protein